VLWQPDVLSSSVSHLKIKFYRAFNCIYTRSKAASSEMVAVELLKAYCLPLLLYASESVSLTPSQLHELNNCINRAVFRIFGVSNGCTVKDIRNFVGLDDMAKIVEKKFIKFMDRLIDSRVGLYGDFLSYSLSVRNYS